MKQLQLDANFIFLSRKLEDVQKRYSRGLTSPNYFSALKSGLYGLPTLVISQCTREMKECQNLQPTVRGGQPQENVNWSSESKSNTKF